MTHHRVLEPSFIIRPWNPAAIAADNKGGRVEANGLRADVDAKRTFRRRNS